MDVNIHIYLKKLKDFFNNDKEAYNDMFGVEKVDMVEFYKMVTKKATSNVKKNGDPMLSGEEMLEIITNLAFKEIKEEIEIQNFIKKQKEIDKIFTHIKGGFPPICLN
mgnify:CR=1 FL=1|jgi:hypothetical protein|tara:strand:+ start:188 stop:511 length:324 start_codon:yes stop_codon:yes gene_type:complete